MTGVHRPDRGEISRQGETLEISNPLVAQQHRIAAIYQEASLFPDLDIAENIFMGHYPTGATGWIRWRKMYEDAARPLQSLGVNLDPHTPGKT